MDIEEFDWQYPTPEHASAADRRERLPLIDRARFDYLLRSRARCVNDLTGSSRPSDRVFIQGTIDMADRMLARMERTACKGR